MPSTTVTVWFDYSCPHSFIGLNRLVELASSMDIEIDRRPFLVRFNSPGFVEESVVPNNLTSTPVTGRRQPLYSSVLGVVGMDTEPASNRSVSTLAIHAATSYAKEQGLDGDFFALASKEYWELGTDLGNLYSIRRLSVAAGLDWEQMWPQMESGDYHKMVLAQHEAAVASGITQTPTFQIGGRLHSGNMGFEELRSAVQAAA
ncbi:MAG: hypothetical protein CL902_04350 [Dehalococcoidia bacterium]|nr:hypothetical protein [Dehalococcoidia bacterium]